MNLSGGNLGFGSAVKNPLDENTYGTFGTGIDQTGQMWDSGVGALGQGTGMLTDAATGFGKMAGANPGTLAGSDMSGYMNPFTQGVIDPTMNELNRQEALQQNKVDAAAQAAGAFGGDRMQIQKAAMNRDFDVTRKDAIANLYKTSFDNATAGRKFDISNAMSREAGGNAGLAGIGNNMSNMGANFLNNANSSNKDWANMGFGWGTNLQNQDLAMGTLQQQQQQKMMDAIKAQFQGYTSWPQTGLDILTGNNPSAQGQGTTKETNTPSVGGIISKILGF